MNLKLSDINLYSNPALTKINLYFEDACRIDRMLLFFLESGTENELARKYANLHSNTLHFLLGMSLDYLRKQDSTDVNDLDNFVKQVVKKSPEDLSQWYLNALGDLWKIGTVEVEDYKFGFRRMLLALNDRKKNGLSDEDYNKYLQLTELFLGVHGNKKDLLTFCEFVQSFLECNRLADKLVDFK